MAYNLTTTPRGGLQVHRYTGAGEVFWLPGDPGVTFTANHRYALSGGVLVAATDSAANAVFSPVRTVTAAGATTAFTHPRDVDPPGQTADTTLIPCRVDVPHGTPVYLANIANYQDETVVSYDAGTRAVEFTTGFGADDRPNGAWVYVYEGPGIGEANIIEDYDHTGGAAELLGIMHRPFSATLATSSKMVVLSATAAANAVGPFGRVDLKDANEVDVSDGADDGDFIIYAGWLEVPEFLSKGQIPVINRTALYT